MANPFFSLMIPFFTVCRCQRTRGRSNQPNTRCSIMFNGTKEFSSFSLFSSFHGENQGEWQNASNVSISMEKKSPRVVGSLSKYSIRDSCEKFLNAKLYKLQRICKLNNYAITPTDAVTFRIVRILQKFLESQGAGVF